MVFEKDKQRDAASIFLVRGRLHQKLFLPLHDVRLARENAGYEREMAGPLPENTRYAHGKTRRLLENGEREREKA